MKLKPIYQGVIKLTLALSGLLLVACGSGSSPQPNILLIVADDLNYDSPGYAGGVAPEVTPNIDRLAAESFSFEQAFSTVSVCQPSRQSMLSGLIPSHYGSGGFFPMRSGVPTLPSMLGEAGYLTGNIHKMHHMLPLDAFLWDFDNHRLGLHAPDGVVGRDPQAIGGALRRFIRTADRQDQPFFMVVNSADPHRPFHGDPVQPGNWFWGKEEVFLKKPSRVYGPEEVNIPPSLPDIPEIRIDLAKYASSVRRLDDTVGECLKVLEELQVASSTLVIFVSDNGMPLPFSKFDCYLGSNRSPLLMRWPELIKNPAVDHKHLVSLMDLTPTVLELAGVPVPASLDGRSLVPFLENSTPEEWRKDIVFLRNADIYYPSGIESGLKNNPGFIDHLEEIGWVARPDHPNKGTYSREKEMRAYFNGKFGYIYNQAYRSKALHGSELGLIVPYTDPSLRGMKMSARQDQKIRERYQFYLLREKEELYDWISDPGSRINLAMDPGFQDQLIAARIGLGQWMESVDDPLLAEYENYLNSLQAK